MVINRTVDLYWGRSSRIVGNGAIDLLKRMTLYISTGDGVVGHGAVYLYCRRCGTLPNCRSLLGTVQ